MALSSLSHPSEQLGLEAPTLPPPPKMTTCKVLAESPDLKSIPSSYVHFSNSDKQSEAADPDDLDSLPIIDFFLLVSGNPHQRSKVIQELGRACRQWGFFIVVNHGVPESMMKGVIDGCNRFFNQTEKEKREFEGKHVLDPIRCGTSFNTAVEKVFFWRDFLKVFVHPHFHFPNKPQGFSELAFEYCKRIRAVARQLLRGISESLDLEEDYIEKTQNLDSGLQIFTANLYPPCPQPELAMGMPPHSDHGLLTILIENQVGGLQIQRNGKWFNVNSLPNSFLVNTADQLELLSNGEYKSVMHRAVVNNRATRISVAIGNGPSLDTIVSPSPEMIDKLNNPPAYIPMKYRDYLEQQQSNQLDRKSCLDRVRVHLVWNTLK